MPNCNSSSITEKNMFFCNDPSMSPSGSSQVALFWMHFGAGQFVPSKDLPSFVFAPVAAA